MVLVSAFSAAFFISSFPLVTATLVVYGNGESIKSLNGYIASPFVSARDQSNTFEVAESGYRLVKRGPPSGSSQTSGTVRPYNARASGEFIRKAALHRIRNDPFARIGKGEKTHWTQQQKWMDRAKAAYENNPVLIKEQVQYYTEKLNKASTQIEKDKAAAKKQGWEKQLHSGAEIKDASKLALDKVRVKTDKWYKVKTRGERTLNQKNPQVRFAKWKMKSTALVGDQGKKLPTDPAYVEYNADRLLHKHAELIKEQDSLFEEDRKGKLATNTDREARKLEIQGKIATSSMQALGWHSAAGKLRLAQRKAAAADEATGSGKRPAEPMDRKGSFKRQSTMEHDRRSGGDMIR